MRPFKKAQVEVLARNLGVDYSAIQMKRRLIDAITTARTANGWSQSQLADELGETEEVISQMETKTRTRQISLG